MPLRTFAPMVASAHDSWLPIVLIAIAAVVVAGFVVFCLGDLARADQVRYLPKWAWVLVIIFAHILGGTAYLIFGNKRSTDRLTHLHSPTFRS
jgi:threonine/homoserine/homoserine lactone efflux protein